jgi:glycosyltransferase involved in cell wall biosynthesis
MSRPIAFVMEQTLGNVTHYLNLRQQQTAAFDCPLHWIPIDYRPTRLPWTVTGGLLARRALKPLFNEVGGVFVHTATLAPLVADLLGKKPAVLSCDGTPLNKRAMRQPYGLRPERRLEELAKRAFYRKMFGGAVGLVGWSNWTKQSFVEDYGCREEDVAVIPPGIDLEKYSGGERCHELPRLLFVGADFIRKGGDLLLDVFRQRLRGRAELILVTHAELQKEPGVTLYRDLQANSDTLRNLYATADVFVQPTRADCLPLAWLEALASGLPIVATRIGGILDVVQPDETGYVIEVDDANALGDALETLICDPERRRLMSERSREEARRRFDVRENSRRLFEFVRSRCER